MVNWKSHIIATIQMRPPGQSPRKKRTPSEWFGCPCVVDEEKWDCRLDLTDIGAIEPGDRVSVPMVFLSPQEVLPKLHPGKTFQLWDRGIIADGVVEKILTD